MIGRVVSYQPFCENQRRLQWLYQHFAGSVENGIQTKNMLSFWKDDGHVPPIADK